MNVNYAQYQALGEHKVLIVKEPDVKSDSQKKALEDIQKGDLLNYEK